MLENLTHSSYTVDKMEIDADNLAEGGHVMMNLDPPNMDICNETEHKLSVSCRICSNKCVLLMTAPITVLISLRIQLPGYAAHCKLRVICTMNGIL